MNTKQITDAFDLFIDTWGHEMQLIMCIEELSELQKEITKYLRGDGSFEHMMEELADVKIVTGQLEYMFFNNQYNQNRIQEIIDNKISRAVDKATWSN